MTFFRFMGALEAELTEGSPPTLAMVARTIFRPASPGLCKEIGVRV